MCFPSAIACISPKAGDPHASRRKRYATRATSCALFVRVLVVRVRS
ncbi:hypothetical protein FTUN_7854 [Frigoriglobus tundricola]|uniref:Uncharacterized protein n=1 Tax=Frigoriglobus tundricola TaxID=2774151 RepID=A0A6M5Z1J7_9BACT|nr:hypothetical protein FTUN_7854 [Frigoriglobus tundricola]